MSKLSIGSKHVGSYNALKLCQFLYSVFSLAYNITHSRQLDDCKGAQPDFVQLQWTKVLKELTHKIVKFTLQLREVLQEGFKRGLIGTQGFYLLLGSIAWIYTEDAFCCWLKPILMSCFHAVILVKSQFHFHRLGSISI